MNLLKCVFAMLALSVLAACGGGGGSSGAPFGGSVTCTLPQVAQGGVCVTPTVTPTYSVTVGIQDSTKASASTMLVGSAFTARAVVMDATGLPVGGKLVTFAVSSAIANLTPATALTDATGVASVSIVPVSAGAATLSATIAVGTTPTVGQADFAVSAPSAIGAPSVKTTLLNANGTVVTNLLVGSAFSARALVLDAAGLPVIGRVVTFSINSGIATLSPSTALTDASGIASVAAVPLAAGAATLSASASIGSLTASGQSDFGVQAGGSLGTPTLKAAIVNAANVATTSITVGSSYFARATVTDASGSPVIGRLVTFAVSSPIATLNPATALTDSTGAASVAITPASISAAGAASLSATAQVGASPVAGQSDFAVSASSLTLSSITAGKTSLASGGNTSLAVTALIGASPASSIPVGVTFTVSCGKVNGTDTSAGVTTNGSGVASATYSAVASDGSPCSGAVNVVANTVGVISVPLVLTVDPPVANALTYVSATPSQVFVKGSGSVEQSLLKFKVWTSTGASSPNTAVNFSLVNNPGEVSLSAFSGTSDSKGEVTLSVFSGTIPGPVKVRATLASDLTVFSESQNLTVASGPPSQRYMSVAVGTFNIEGQNRDGVGTTLTVRLADRQGNPVDDGTVVNFTAEGGQVASSCATSKVNGISSCSVNYVSQNPRPTDGRVTILAYTQGTKDYVDNDANNIFNAGDTLINQGDAYRDDYETGMFSTGEFTLPLGGQLSCPVQTDMSFPSRAMTCTNDLATMVRQQVVLLNSSSVPTITRTNVGDVGSIGFKLASLDNPLLPMPAGTTISAQAVDGTSGNGLNCTVGTIFNSVVSNIPPHIGNLSENLTTNHVVGLKDCAAGDLVEVKITTPSGQVYSQVFTL